MITNTNIGFTVIKLLFLIKRFFDSFLFVFLFAPVGVPKRPEAPSQPQNV